MPLTWGGGLDRGTGIAKVQPANFSDLRNLELLTGTAEVRKGLAQEALGFVGGGATPYTDIVALTTAYSVLGAPNPHFIGYDSASKKLEAYSATIFGATIFTTAGSLGPSQKSFFLAEIYRKIFIAQDVAYALREVPTTYWDTAGGAITVLQGDFDGLGAQNVVFRGVVAYLNYIIGWGFGSNTDKNRPDVIRVSLPGQPTVFNKEHYFLAGGGTVLNCVPAGGKLLVFKDNEIRTILGSNRANFGISQAIDPEFGLAGSRLVATTPDGTTYFWSPHGPRFTTGGPSEDIGYGLKLDAPEPSGLVSAGAMEQGFAVYVPGKELVKFIFGQQRGYVLHLRDKQPRWSYEEYAVPIRCAGRYPHVGAAGTPADPSIKPMYGRSGGHKVLYNAGFQDDGVDYQAQATSDPAAPAGPDGECSFYTLWLAVTHTMACTLRVTPIIDGVALATKDVTLTAKGSRTTEVFEVGLQLPMGAAGVTAPRGTWFSAKVATLVAGAPAIATGDLLFDLSSLEYTVERETRAAV